MMLKRLLEHFRFQIFRLFKVHATILTLRKTKTRSTSHSSISEKVYRPGQIYLYLYPRTCSWLRAKSRISRWLWSSKKYMMKNLTVLWWEQGKACWLLSALVLSLIVEVWQELVLGYFILEFLLWEHHSTFSLLVTSVANHRWPRNLALASGRNSILPQLPPKHPVSLDICCCVNILDICCCVNTLDTCCCVNTLGCLLFCEHTGHLLLCEHTGLTAVVWTHWVACCCMNTLDAYWCENWIPAVVWTHWDACCCMNILGCLLSSKHTGHLLLCEHL